MAFVVEQMKSSEREYWWHGSSVVERRRPSHGPSRAREQRRKVISQSLRRGVSAQDTLYSCFEGSLVPLNTFLSGAARSSTPRQVAFKLVCGRLDKIGRGRSRRRAGKGRRDRIRLTSWRYCRLSIPHVLKTESPHRWRVGRRRSFHIATTSPVPTLPQAVAFACC